MRPMRFFLYSLLVAVVLVLVRVLTDAILLEPHYYWPLRNGLLRAPLLLGFLPLTLLADLAAAAVITAAVQSHYAGRTVAGLLGMLLCVALAHAGQGNPLKLPLIIPMAWVLTSAAGAFASAWLVEALKPQRDFQPEAEQVELGS